MSIDNEVVAEKTEEAQIDEAAVELVNGGLGTALEVTFTLKGALGGKFTGAATARIGEAVAPEDVIEYDGIFEVIDGAQEFFGELALIMAIKALKGLATLDVQSKESPLGDGESL